ncbi:isochorismatase [Candidatus Daviesbacteria bacterium]|nr:isochorismatase [Candidatus Daviesbacteria bacterium]
MSRHSNIEIVDPLKWPPEKSAAIVCDMWNEHWSRGATERVDLLAPEMNMLVRRLRDKGLQIIHSPTHVAGFYEDTLARERIKQVPLLESPGSIIDYNFPLDPPLPIDDSDGGSDTGEEPPRKFQRVWTRQHPAIEIDHSRDAISDLGVEIYSFLRGRNRFNVFIMGVHANMCILKRQFGIRQMQEWGFNMALVGDMTDAMYNPSMPPFVSHAEGTRLVVEYIRRNWCPVVHSSDLYPENQQLPPEQGGISPFLFPTG